jgi:hypothetical protein
MNTTLEAKAENARLKLHFSYVTVILIAIIVLLATYHWTEIKGFTDYLTAAGTMVSIVLGVLAIIYSFVSGDSVSRSLGNVASAASELQAARQDFSNIVTAASDLTTLSRASSSELNELLGVVRTEVQELRAASTKLGESTEGIAQTVGQMPARLDKIDSRLDESLKGAKQRTSAPPVSGGEELAMKVVKGASQYGKALLYAVSLGKFSGKSFSLKASPFVGADEYSYGFLLALHAVGMLDFETPGKGNRTIKIIAFPLHPEEVFEALQPFFGSSRGLDTLLANVKAMFDDELDEKAELVEAT